MLLSRMEESGLRFGIRDMAGWDGSEEMITLSSPYCTHFPEHARITLFSGEFMKTAIVTLQDAHATVALGLALSGNRESSDGFITFMGVGLIFFLLGFIGLSNPPPAFKSLVHTLCGLVRVEVVLCNIVRIQGRVNNIRDGNTREVSLA